MIILPNNLISIFNYFIHLFINYNVVCSIMLITGLNGIVHLLVFNIIAVC